MSKLIYIIILLVAVVAAWMFYNYSKATDTQSSLLALNLEL